MTSAPHRVGDGDGRGGEPRLGYRDARVVERQRTSERRSARGARGNRRDRGRRCWARGWRRACKWLTRWRGSGWAIGKISPVPRPAGMMLRAPAAIAAASRRNHADEAFTARRSIGSPLARRACASASRSAHKSTHPWERIFPASGGMSGAARSARGRAVIRTAVSDPTHPWERIFPASGGMSGAARARGRAVIRTAVSDPKEKTETNTRASIPDAPPTASATAAPARGEDVDRDASVSASAAAAIPLAFFALLIGVGAYYKEDINEFLTWFIGYVDSLGPSGPALFMVLYVALEILAVPAIPLTMSAGAIFGPVQGTAMVSVSATIAATASFLIARYALRDKIRSMADEYPKFAAIDNAIGEDSFRVVALLRLSPLLPFALSNYLYGITSVKTRPYVLASWLGMLPGTFAYVSAGSVGRTMMEAGAGAEGGGGDWTHVAQVVCGFGFALLSGSYVANLASEALRDVEEEMNAIGEK